MIIFLGDMCLNESRAIAGYLVNKYGKSDSLYPKVIRHIIYSLVRFVFHLLHFYLLRLLVVLNMILNNF